MTYQIISDSTCDLSPEQVKKYNIHLMPLYVTLEPCPMCAGAIMNARIPRIVYGAKDTVNGCCGSAVDLFMLPCSQKPEIVSGVLEEEAAALLSGFFRRLREKRKKSDGMLP